MQTERRQDLVSAAVNPGDRKTVMDKTQHEYLAGKLKLQNTEKDQAKERKSNILQSTGGTSTHL